MNFSVRAAFTRSEAQGASIVRRNRIKVKRYFVIDKSYLQGAKAAEIHSICASGAIMSDTLYAELITTTPEARRRCFMKFPSGINPIHIIPSIGGLLQHEMTTRSSCTPLIDLSPYAQFEFHEGLSDGTYQFTDLEFQSANDIMCEIQERLIWFRMASAAVDSWFPEIRGFRANGPSAPIDEAMNSVTTDQERVRAIYCRIVEEMRSLLNSGSVPPVPNFMTPDPSAINESWAWFRLLQAFLVSALEFVRKNGPGNHGQILVGLEHDFLDTEYLVVGALTGALASRDKTVQRFFRQLCPDGQLMC